MITLNFSMVLVLIVLALLALVTPFTHRTCGWIFEGVEIAIGIFVVIKFIMMQANNFNDKWNAGLLAIAGLVIAGLCAYASARERHKPKEAILDNKR